MARTAPRQPGAPAGVIFGCNRSSEEESLNGLFGMSSGHWSLVKEIIPGTPCFLFNFNTKELHGVFRAVSAGAWNIDPLAYGGKPKEGSMYPAQVRVEYCPRCPPMEEQYFKPAIAANYFNPNRFRWELNERQVEELLDLFLGPGMPWPPRQDGANRQPRLEHNHDAPAYIEDTVSRSYTIEPLSRPMLEGYRERDSSYGARHGYGASPPHDTYRKPYDRSSDEETRHRRVAEDALPRSLQPRRHDSYRRSVSPHDRYRDRRNALPEEMRLAPPRTEMIDTFRPQLIPEIYRPDLRQSMPPSTSALSSLYGDTMNIHHVAGAAIRDPSLALSPNAVRRTSPPRQHMLLESASHRQQLDAQPVSPPFDFSNMSHVGDQFTGLASDTAVLDQPGTSLPALPADLTLSERFQHLPEHKEQHDTAQIGTAPLRVSLSAAAGRAVSFPQPDTVAKPSVVPASVSTVPTTLVIGSIPQSCTISILVSILDQRHQDQYDFLHYQPSEEFDSTAVVNFTRPQYAHEFQEELQDASWSDLHRFDPPTSAIASVNYHSIQGKDALMAHHSKSATRFGGAPGNESRLPVNRPLFFFCAGRKRPAPVEHEQAPAPVRPRMPSTAGHDSYSHPAAMQGLPPATHAVSRGELTQERGYGAAVKMEPESGHSGFASEHGAPMSPSGRLMRPESASNMSEHDRAQIRSRPGSAAAISSRPPPEDSLEPLKITIKQEPGLDQPITPSPDSALDVMGHTLSMLDGPSRGVSSSPVRAGLPVSQQEAAAFLQTLAPELQQLQHKSKSPRRRSRSPSRHSHRHHSSNKQHGSKSSRPSRADKDSDRHDSKPSSRRPSHLEHKSSRGVQKVSGRDKPPRDRSSKDRDTKHRSKPAEAKIARSTLQESSDLPMPPPLAAAGRSIHVSVNAAPAVDQPSSRQRKVMPAVGALGSEEVCHPHQSAGYPTEEAVADNAEGLQQPHEFEPVRAMPSIAAREQQPLTHSIPPAARRHAEFGADFLAIPSSP